MSIFTYNLSIKRAKNWFLIFFPIYKNIVPLRPC